jgi:hypothetical protein
MSTSPTAIIGQFSRLSKDDKKLVDKKRPYHILTAFFEVSEQPTQKKSDLHQSILDAFSDHIQADSDLSLLSKKHILVGNENKPF